MFVDQFGRPQGSVIDYWSLWAERTGSKLRFELLPWDEVLDRFRQGHGDILLGAIKTPERELWLDFSRPYISVQVGAYVRDDVPEADSAKRLKDLQGLRIGVLHVDSCQVYLSANAPSGAVTATYSSTRAMIDDAVAGRIDAFVGYPDETDEALRRLHEQASFHPLADSLQTMDICAATRKGQQALLRRIDQGMALINPDDRDAIWRQWRVPPPMPDFQAAMPPPTATPSPTLALTQDRPSSSVSLVALGRDRFPPFIFLDPSSQPRGYSIDFWKLWARRTNTKLRIELMPWDKVLERFSQGQGDFVLGVIKTPERARWLDFTCTYTATRVEAYVRNNVPGAQAARKLSDLKGLRVGYQDADPCRICVATYAPAGSVTTAYPTCRAMVEDAVAGRIDAFIGYSIEIPDELARYRLANVFHLLPDSRMMMDMSAVTRKGQKELLRRIEAGLATITQKEKDAISRRWQTQPPPPTAPVNPLLVTFLILLFIVLFIILSIVVVTTLFYRLRVKRRLASLTQGLSQEAREKELALAGMRFTEQRLKAFAEALSGVMMLLDGEGRCLDVLGSADRLPASRHVLLSGTIRQAMPSEAAEAIMNAIGLAIAERGLQVVEYELDGATGKRAFEGRMTLIPESPQDHPLVVLLVLDVTEHKRLRDHLRQSQKMEAIGRLAGGVAHDFNNILTAMAGFVDLAAEDMEKRPKQARQSLEEIVKAIRRAADLTRQLLSFSRQQAISRRPLNLNDRACHIEKMLRRLIGESIQIRLELDAGLDPILADPGQIDQVILNLTVNARDAMPAGGRLVIATRNADMQDQTRGPTGMLRPGQYVVLEVSDTGIGIDSETLGRIFEPFFTTKGRDKGTGLGLSIVYGIVKQTGGDIACDSQLGKGTTFRVYFPRHRDEATDLDASIAEAKARSPLGPVTVLVVEDDSAVRLLACRALRENGLNVLETSDADQALRLIEANPKPIRLLVSDVIMPGMSGPELARRALLRSPGLKIILLSSYTGTNVKLPLDMAADAQILLKPFLPEDLIARARKALEIPGELLARL